jgi:uncharacterized membrane protein
VVNVDLLWLVLGLVSMLVSLGVAMTAWGQRLFYGVGVLAAGIAFAWFAGNFGAMSLGPIILEPRQVMLMVGLFIGGTMLVQQLDGAFARRGDDAAPVARAAR